MIFEFAVLVQETGCGSNYVWTIANRFCCGTVDGWTIFRTSRRHIWRKICLDFGFHGGDVVVSFDGCCWFHCHFVSFKITFSCNAYDARCVFLNGFHLWKVLDDVRKLRKSKGESICSCFFGMYFFDFLIFLARSAMRKLD